MKQNTNSLTSVFWTKIQQDMRMEVLLDKKPLKQLKLYELEDDEIGIDLEQVTLWSTNNTQIYAEVQENGFADFICNREHMLESYTNLVFDSENINEMDNSLLHLQNLKLLRLNHNNITVVQNMPTQLQELHLFNNPITSLNLIRHNLQFLGLGYCQLDDDAIQCIPKSLPALLSLDLVHNKLCDLEYTVEMLKQLGQLKVLALNGNPIVLMPQYLPYIIDNLLKLKYFDQSKYIDIKNRLLQVELDKQARIAEAARKQQEEIELQQKLLADKNKKGGKAAPPPVKQEVPMPPPVIMPEPMQSIRIQIEDARNFKINLKVQTLENLDGILLDKFTYPLMEAQPGKFQSKYIVQCQFFNELVQSTEILYENATIENEIGRINFQFQHEGEFAPEVKIRDQIENGLMLIVKCQEPKMIITEEGEKKPVLVDEIPEQEDKILGVCKIDLDWLRGQNKLINKKYRLFGAETMKSAEMWHPFDEEAEKIQSRMEFIQKQIQAEIEQKKALQAQLELKREQIKGKGKDVKKKDDKKAAKKGKDEVEKPVVGVLDWVVHDRQYVYVNDNTIHRASGILLAVSVELS